MVLVIRCIRVTFCPFRPQAFEAGKIATMTALVEHFAGIPGQPFAGSTGVRRGSHLKGRGCRSRLLRFVQGRVQHRRVSLTGFILYGTFSND